MKIYRLATRSSNLLAATFLILVSCATKVAAETGSCPLAFNQTGEFNREEFSNCLEKGVRLEVHGIAKDQKISVAALRSTKNFFVFQHLSLLGATPPLREEILGLSRHDSIIVKGEISENNAPQIHVRVFELVVDKKYELGDELKDFPYDTKIPDELMGKNSLKAVVHAVFEEGKILVIDYKDVVLPVFVEDALATHTSALYRNDIIELSYEIQTKPGRPVHLKLIQDKDSSIEPVKIVDAMKDVHGQKSSINGELVLFPKSPQVLFNVFALKVDQGDGLYRHYTLVNFDDPKMFEKIRMHLQEVWDRNKQNKKKDRNKWRNPKIRVTATGILNVQDPNQANPQVMLPDLRSLIIAELP